MMGASRRPSRTKYQGMNQAAMSRLSQPQMPQAAPPQAPPPMPAPPAQMPAPVASFRQPTAPTTAPMGPMPGAAPRTANPGPLPGAPPMRPTTPSEPMGMTPNPGMFQPPSTKRGPVVAPPAPPPGTIKAAPTGQNNQSMIASAEEANLRGRQQAQFQSGLQMFGGDRTKALHHALKYGA